VAGKYTVIWKRVIAERDLAELIVSFMETGESVAPITRAVAQIDRLLATDPEGVGESRENFERVLIVAPITVYHEVHDETKTTYVNPFRYCPPRPKN
jgi:hypothetical protein